MIVSRDGANIERKRVLVKARFRRDNIVLSVIQKAQHSRKQRICPDIVVLSNRCIISR